MLLKASVATVEAEQFPGLVMSFIIAFAHSRLPFESYLTRKELEKALSRVVVPKEIVSRKVPVTITLLFLSQVTDVPNA